MPTYDRIEGIGRVRVYDSGPRFADRYTILMEDWDVYDGTETTPHKPKPYGNREGFAVGDNVGPNGFSQSIQCPPPTTWGTGKQARRIPFASLPPEVQAHVIRRSTED
jgi:hypothetical protein